RVGQIFPGSGDTADVRLTTEFSFATHFARDTRHFGCEGTQLVHHRVDRVLELQNLAAHIHSDLLRQVAVRDRGRDLGNVSHLAGEVAGHEIHAVGKILPGSGNAADIGLAAEAPFRSHFARHAGYFRRE